MDLVAISKKLKQPNDIELEKQVIQTKAHKIPILICRPLNSTGIQTGILWIHGGGYFTGMKEMVYLSRALDLVKKYNVTVISVGYRLSIERPYPAALFDCYKTLLYMKEHAQELRINPNQIMIGGESAGGGLCAALCLLARDRGSVNIAYQMPLYPMLDCYDTESSKDNKGKVWNTKRNHLGWKLYLRNQKITKYASPAREVDYTHLPPAYTFVGDGEPFYTETLAYIRKLKEVGIEAEVDVYHEDMHAFDLMEPDAEQSKEAIQNFEKHFVYALEHYFAEQ